MQTVITVTWDYSVIRTISPCYIMLKEQSSQTKRWVKGHIQPQRPLKSKEMCTQCSSCDTYLISRRHKTSSHQQLSHSTISKWSEALLHSVFVYPRPKSHLITFTSVSPPAAERNCFILPLDRVPTLLNASGQDIQPVFPNCCHSPLQLMTVFITLKPFICFFWLINWLCPMVSKEIS